MRVQLIYVGFISFQWDPYEFQLITEKLLKRLLECVADKNKSVSLLDNVVKFYNYLLNFRTQKTTIFIFKSLREIRVK